PERSRSRRRSLRKVSIRRRRSSRHIPEGRPAFSRSLRDANADFDPHPGRVGPSSTGHAERERPLFVTNRSPRPGADKYSFRGRSTPSAFARPYLKRPFSSFFPASFAFSVTWVFASWT